MKFRANLLVFTVLASGVMASGAQAPSSPDKGLPVKPGTAPTPVPTAPLTAPGTTPPKLQPGKTVAEVEHRLTKAEKDELLKDVDNIFAFASKDSGLPIKHPVKRQFISREEVNKFLRKKFDEDKGNRRMERSELVLKKFGLIDRDFHLRPFLLSLLTEQIAGFYDNKTQTMYLLDWVPVDEQKPVMAHELTHALQDQHVGLTKWQNQGEESVSHDVSDDNKHIRTDETDTAREAVLEGQAMVAFADYVLRDSGKTLKDVPAMAQQLQSGAGDMSGSPVLARAPLLLQQALLFPYVAGLSFEDTVLTTSGVGRAFTGVLDAPPGTSAEILHPEQYLGHTSQPLMNMPDIHPVLSAAGYEPYDIGVMGELDVRITAELFGGRPLAEALAPAWSGGIYYAAQKKDATVADKDDAKSIALLYSSQWKNEDSARSFFTVFDEELPRQYDGLTRQKNKETSDDERVFATHEGDVLLTLSGKSVWVSEGFDLTLARKLQEMVNSAQGVGPVRSADLKKPGGGEPRQGLTAGIISSLSGYGVSKALLNSLR